MTRSFHASMGLGGLHDPFEAYRDRGIEAEFDKANDAYTFIVPLEDFLHWVDDPDVEANDYTAVPEMSEDMWNEEVSDNFKYRLEILRDSTGEDYIPLIEFMGRSRSDFARFMDEEWSRLWLEQYREFLWFDFEDSFNLWDEADEFWAALNLKHNEDGTVDREGSTVRVFIPIDWVASDEGQGEEVLRDAEYADSNLEWLFRGSPFVFCFSVNSDNWGDYIWEHVGDDGVSADVIWRWEDALDRYLPVAPDAPHYYPIRDAEGQQQFDF